MIGTLLLTGFCFLLLGMISAPHPRRSVALTLAACAAGLAAAVGALTGDTWELRVPWRLGREQPHLILDAISAWFLVILGVVGGLGALYASAYWGDRERPDSSARGRLLWNALLLVLGLVLLSANGLHFLILWELFAVLSWMLITLDPRPAAVRRAGWIYLAASHAGTLSLFGFFSLLALQRGSWDLGPHLIPEPSLPLFALCVFGFGMKAGFFPLHIWLPPAHANAPSHVSAILSGVAVKMGIYGLFRFTGWMPAPAHAGDILVLFGASSAVIGIALGAVQNDLKRLLAYCTVENIGVILCGIGLALAGRERGLAGLGALALMGALLHVWNHAFFKALLFFGAGSVLHATGTRRMSRLGGLARQMPGTAAAFLIGSLAVAGLPPLNGFVSEWLVYRGLVEGVARGHSGVAALALLLLAMAGAIALAAFAKLCGVVLLGAPRTRAAAHAHEAAPPMTAAMATLALLCVQLGVAPATVRIPLAAVTSAWEPAWTAPLAPHAPLGSLPAVLALALLVATAGVSALLRRRPLRRGPTWDCGYAQPTRRMQYSSGSFSGWISQMLRGLLRPIRQLRRPRGILPSATARDIVEQPDPVLDGALTTLARPVRRLAAGLASLQHGRLHAYILYLLFGMAAIAILTFLGAAP